MSFTVKNAIIVALVFIVAVVIVGCSSFNFGGYIGQGDSSIDLGHYVNGAKTMNSVVFPHWKHQRKLDGDCSQCHIGSNHQLKDRTTNQLLDTNIKAGDAGNKFHLDLCWQCHDARHITKVGSSGNCEKCHKGSK